MSSIDALEASLQARWDRDTLAVYADALAARGDPRGELIALDLHGAADPDIEARRHALLVQWLGGTHLLGEPWPLRAFRFGLLEDIVVGSGTQHTAEAFLEAVLASPVGPYLRGVTLPNGAPEVARAIAILAAEPRPWLHRLAIRQYEAGPIDRALFARFVAATPHLAELDLAGERVAATPLHPNAATLRLQTTSIVVTGAAMPHVRAIDLAFDDDELADQAGIVNPRLVPNLVELDLSRNENVYPRGLPGNVGPFPFVDAIEDLARLHRLRLPSLRRREEVERALALLELHPHLSIEIARSYRDSIAVFDGVAHPRLHVPPPRPWPPRDVTAGREALTVIAGPREREDLALASIIELLEDSFDDMPVAARAAWTELFEFLDALDWEDEAGKQVKQPYPVAPLVTALRELAEDDRRCHETLAMLDAALAKRPLETVIVHRYWGW